VTLESRRFANRVRLTSLRLEQSGRALVASNISQRLEARVRRDYPPQVMTEEVIAFLCTVSDDHALLEGNVSRIRVLRCFSCGTGAMVSCGRD
jgi:hypothetical protein